VPEPTRTGLALGILTVAIGDLYIEYWSELAESISEQTRALGTVTIHVFTDNPERIREVSRDLQDLQIDIHEVPSYGWPDATLRRYEMFRDQVAFFSDDCLMYLDADMLLSEAISKEDLQLCVDRGVLLVRHPGYYRPKGLPGKIRFYALNPLGLARDLIRWARFGAIGDWETRSESSAYLPRALRKDYVCGGTWMGERVAIGDVIQQLADATEADRSIGLTARWHDESHLNRLHGETVFATLPPSWCYIDDAPQLRGLTAVVRAVDKGTRRTR
jgi:hypothetical protein